jgi:histidyl-tRNA synthetase
MTAKTRKSSATDKFISYEHLDKIGEIAVYYGFTPMKSPTITKADISAAKDILDGDSIDDETDKHGKLPLHAEEKIALIRMYQEENLQTLPQPVMIYFKDPSRGTIKKAGYHRYADLEIIGSSGSIAEATLVQTARIMLAEEGYTETMVEINSIGDKDSLARFSRELTAYYRKNINEMSPECRQIMKRDVFELLSSHDSEAIKLNEQAPRSMDFLSEVSRRHLEEVLEYFETLKIPYTINNSLIGNRAYCTETIFAITDTRTGDKKSKQKVLAIGVRYNSLAKKLGIKRDTQGVGISIIVPSANESLRKQVKKMKRPVASFMQLCLEAKLISLEVIENLRAVKVPLYLSLAKDRLGAQVSLIEKYHTPYSIVIGKKEAVERTAIVRRTDTHAQEIVALADLPKYMKKLDK